MVGGWRENNIYRVWNHVTHVQIIDTVDSVDMFLFIVCVLVSLDAACSVCHSLFVFSWLRKTAI